MAKKRNKDPALEADGVVEPQVEPVPAEEPVEEPPPPEAAEPPPLPEIPPEGTPDRIPSKPNGAPPERKLPKVTLRVFLSACGRKPDQRAGFKFFAEKNHRNAKFTIPEWQEIWNQFTDRPMGR